MSTLGRIGNVPFVRWLWNHPRVLLAGLTVLILWRVIALGHLTYGDIPYFDDASSKVNFLYAWGGEQLGTPVRQSFNTVRDALLQLISPASIVFYVLKYVLPLVLIPQLYYWIYSRLGLKSKPVLLIGSLFPLFTPIVFGDFLTGQTFWIYLTIPLVFFYAIKIFALRQFKFRNDLLLALWLFLSLGMLPPIIVPLLTIFAVFVSVMLFVHTREDPWRVLLSFALSGVRIGVIFALLALPYLLVASSGQAAYTSPSLLSDYYHNYAKTHLLNTMRMAGNNGSGQNTLGFNDWSITNLAGYGIAAVMILGGIVLGLRERLSRYWVVITGLLAVLLAVLGFMQLLTINTLFGIKVFESQWIVSTVRNPSKLYAILLPVFALLFTFGLGHLLQRFAKKPLKRRAILIATIAVVAIYGWPALRGDLGLLAGREDQISTYRQDPVVQQIAKTPGAREGRTLLLPANHRDELNYQFLNPNLNLLRLEGSLPGSARTMDAVNDALNERNPYFFRYLDAIGVRRVFVKKDEGAYKQALFDLFSVKLTAEQTRGFLASGLKLVNETDSFWEFQNETASDLIYSPRQLTYIKDEESAENNVPFYGKNAAVVNNVMPEQQPSAALVQAYASLPNNQTISKGRAQLHDPSLLVADLYRVGDKAVFDVLSPIDAAPERRVEIPLGTDGDVVSLGDSDYIVTDQKQRVTLRAGDYRALTSTLQPVSLAGQDVSFETDAWQAGDATPREKGEANIYAASNLDKTDGRASMEVGSGGHKAFINMALPVSDSERQYLLLFDYKNLSGAAPSFSLYQGKQQVLPAEGGLEKTNQWKTQAVFFNPLENSRDPVNFYYYSHGSLRQSSENLIDNVRLFEVVDNDVVPVEIQSYPPEYPLNNYRPQQTDNTQHGQNLLSNGSFEDAGLWGKVDDASANAKGKPDLQANPSQDSREGKYSLELRSRNHTAYVARKISRFTPNAVYKLSFDYKHVAGRSAAYAVWQDGAAVSKPSGELKNGNGWVHYETYFVPDQQAHSLTVYFYSRSNGERTVNLYDNVRLETTSLVSTYLSEEASPQKPLQPIVESFERLDPTMIKVTMRPGAGMLVFNESYHQGWQAYVMPGSSVDVRQRLMVASPGKLITAHQTVNGFANGWWVDSSQYPQLASGKNYTILLRYEPQKMLYGGLAVMGVTLAAGVTYLGVGMWRERRQHGG